MAGSRPDDAAAAFATTRPGSGIPGGPATMPTRRPEVGQTVDDFELRQLLGEGAFGRVFLARQVSLDRLVAVKVSLQSGHEGRTLAHLEHNNIVTVYSESAVPERGWRILCMQYVAGTTLQRVIADQDWASPEAGSGPSLLASIDRPSVGATQLDPVALGEREALARADPAEAVCRIGEALAGALTHAHHQGILHRDIKTREHPSQPVRTAAACRLQCGCGRPHRGERSRGARRPTWRPNRSTPGPAAGRRQPSKGVPTSIRSPSRCSKRSRAARRFRPRRGGGRRAGQTR
jgi:hypothetical protein